MSKFDIYAEYIANKISNGRLVLNTNVSLVGLKYLYDRYITSKGISCVFTVSDFPGDFDLNLTQLIRDKMFQAFPDVDTIVHYYLKPLNINVQSDEFKGILNSVSENYSAYKQAFDSLSTDEQLTGYRSYTSQGTISITKSELEARKYLYDSYTYVYKSVMSGNPFMAGHLFVQATAKDKRIIDAYFKELSNVCGKAGLSVQKLGGSIFEYLSGMTPAVDQSNLSRKFSNVFFSSDNLASILPYKTKGIVGSGPLLLGLDWQSKMPFFIDFFSSGSAQVVMLIAQSGFGKTFMAFMTAVNLAAIGIHWSAIDIKGGEWCKLSPYVKTVVINMSGDNARFVNTLRLDDIAVPDDEAGFYYDTAVTGTCNLFEIATNLASNEGSVSDLRAILDTAVSKVFSSHKVYRDNPKSFKRTASLTYRDVLDVITTLESTRSYTEEQKKLCKLIRVRTSAYFMPEGRYASAFKNELTVADILESPGVVYDFNKNQGEVLNTLDSLRVFMVQFLDGKKHTVRRRHGLHTAAFYEELQRSAAFGNLVNAISQNVTGSRSNNLTVFLLLNAVSAFSTSEDFGPIKSNITTKIVGHVVDDDIKALSENFDCGMITDYMNLISHDDGEYQNCFAIQYDTGKDINKAIIKAVVPKEMAEQFETRTSLDFTGKEE